MDLSNAFEDGRRFLETIEARRRNGKVSQKEEASAMAAVKERFREEYRKVRSESDGRQHNHVTYEIFLPDAAGQTEEDLRSLIEGYFCFWH